MLTLLKSIRRRLSMFTWILLSGAFVFSMSPVEVSAISKNVKKTIIENGETKMNTFIDQLIKKMTLDEKIGQMNQVGGNRADTGPINPLSDQGKEISDGRVGSILNSWGVDVIERYQRIAVEDSRLHIPLIFGLDVIHGMKTIFPIPLAQAASWDLKAIENAERIAAKEASATGVTWAFAPMVDIARDPRWGRIAEGSGEDTYLGSKIATARVKGFQGDDLSSKYTIAACCKHFAAYGAAIAGRDYNTVDMSLQLLHDVYLPPYKAAADAGVATFMSSFNTVNGVPATANRYIMRDVLKGDWGSDGFVVSDAGAIQELIAHGFAANRMEAGKQAANAGTDMDMGAGIYSQELPDLVRKGLVPEKYINDAVRRILTIKYKLGLFDDPYRYCDRNREKMDLLTPEHRKASRQLARESIVLLKNDQHILPLNKNTGRIAVIGPLADTKKEMLGCWSFTGDEKDAVSVLEGIRAAVSPETKVLYQKGCEVDSKSLENFDAALATAKSADVVVMVVGEYAEMTGEAHSRAEINIPGNQEELIKQINELGKPLVVLLANGRPLTIPWLARNVSTIVETWFLGTEAGNAIADVLFGDYNPSGKLPASFPVNLGQIPLYYSETATGRPLAENPNNPFRSRYMDCPNEALFPFGFGLSYTTFEYSNLKLNKPEMNSDETLEISVDIKNTGSLQGEEVVQLYIRDLFASVCQPVKVLKRFEKISLEPSEEKTVHFTLQVEDLKFHDANMNWIAEPGDFHLFVGRNSKDLLQTKFTLL